MRKIFSVIAVMTAVCMLGGCGNSGGNKAEATTEMADQQTVRVEVNASEYVELGQYKGLTLDGASTEVTEEELDEQLQAFCEEYAEQNEVTDRDTVKDGDTVNVNFVCMMDGEEVEEYSQEEADITIGEGYYNLSDDFDMEHGIIDAKVGKKITLKLKFPDDYTDEEVAGKPCDMEITINGIYEQIIPKLTDAFIKENTDCDTIDAYREELRHELEEEAASEATSSNESTVWDAVMENATMKKDFTDDMIAQEVRNITIENQDWAEYFGMEMADFIAEYYEMTVEEYAAFNLKQQCVVDLLIEAENIEISDEEYQKNFESMMEEYGMETEEEMYDYYTEDSILEEMLNTKIMQFLIDNNTFK